MSLSVAFKRLTCTIARLQAVGQLVKAVASMALDTAVLLEYKYLEWVSFPKRGGLTIMKNAGILMI